MIAFVSRRKTQGDETEHVEPFLRQSIPAQRRPVREPTDGLIVSELSELEARAICAREDIPVFWPRRDASGRRA